MVLGCSENSRFLLWIKRSRQKQFRHLVSLSPGYLILPSTLFQTSPNEKGRQFWSRTVWIWVMKSGPHHSAITACQINVQEVIKRFIMPLHCSSFGTFSVFGWSCHFFLPSIHFWEFGDLTRIEMSRCFCRTCILFLNHSDRLVFIYVDICSFLPLLLQLEKAGSFYDEAFIWCYRQILSFSVFFFFKFRDHLLVWQAATEGILGVAAAWRFSATSHIIHCHSAVKMLLMKIPAEITAWHLDNVRQ